MFEIENILASDHDIFILSGVAGNAMREFYTGKRTIKALENTLTQKRCGGDRWACAQYEIEDIFITFLGDQIFHKFTIERRSYRSFL